MGDAYGTLDGPRTKDLAKVANDHTLVAKDAPGLLVPSGRSEWAIIMRVRPGDRCVRRLRSRANRPAGQGQGLCPTKSGVFLLLPPCVLGLEGVLQGRGRASRAPHGPHKWGGH